MYRALRYPKNTGEIMNRTEARELAMKCIFQMEAQNEFVKENVENLLAQEQLGQHKEYIDSILNNVCEHIEEINQSINEYSKGWPISRMAKTDLAVTRLAICEILYLDQIPKAVAINEGVELAKRYGNDQSFKFINAILKNIG